MKMFTIIDMSDTHTHCSDTLGLLIGMRAVVFCKHIVPLLELYCAHNSSLLSCRIASWNSHGLLGSCSLFVDRPHALKDNAASRLITPHHICGLIELHTDLLEAEAYKRKWSHSHVSYFSFTEDRNCGGFGLFISKSFINGCQLCFFVDIVPARVIGVLIVFSTLVIFVVCIHNCPTWTYEQRHIYFKRVRARVPCRLRVTTILIGDVNFSDDVVRFDGLRPDTKVSDVHKYLSSVWEKHFCEFVEVAYDCPTFMRGKYLSLIDRGWVNTLPAILLELSPSASVCWEFGDHLGAASDHVPIRLCFGNDGVRVAAIPRWVPTHPDYYNHCLTLHAKVGFLPGSPFATLQRHKAIMLEASRLTLASSSGSGFPLAIDQKIYWAMILIRHRAFCQTRQSARALKSYPYLILIALSVT